MALTRVNGNLITSGTITGNMFSGATITGDKITANTIGSSNLTTTGVAAGTYGGATQIPVVTVGTDGRVTYSANVAFSGSQWTTTGSDIYYTTGKVGVGTSTISSKLDVRNGATNATGINTNANQISILHNSNNGVGGQAEPAGFVVVRDKASTTTNGDFLGGLSWNTRYSDTEARSGYASVLAVATGAGTADLTFNTSSSNLTTAERLRINGNGALVLSGGNTSASGIGITFPASMSDSTDANTLDDYEEGTWTPSVTLNSGTATTYSREAGTYTKTGRMVVCLGRVNPSNGTLGSTNGYIRMTGLPFTVGTLSGAGSGGNISNLNGGVSATFAYSTTADVAFVSGVAQSADYIFVVTYFV